MESIPTHESLVMRINETWTVLQRELEQRKVNDVKVKLQKMDSVIQGILHEYNLTFERLMVTPQRWKQELEQIVAEDHPLYAIVKGKYWRRINKVLDRDERTIELDDIHERWDVIFGEPEEATVRLVSHAVVMIPYWSVDGLWAFKNSFGDGMFRLADDLMHKMICDEQLVLYQGKCCKNN